MRRYIKIIAAFMAISLVAISCKAPCGCGGYGYIDVNKVEYEVEQKA